MILHGIEKKAIEQQYFNKSSTTKQKLTPISNTKPKNTPPIAPTINPLRRRTHTSSMPKKVYPSIRDPLQLRRIMRSSRSNYRSMASNHLAAQLLKQPLKHHINHIYTDMGVRLRFDKLLLEN